MHQFGIYRLAFFRCIFASIRMQPTAISSEQSHRALVQRKNKYSKYVGIVLLTAVARDRPPPLATKQAGGPGLRIMFYDFSGDFWFGAPFEKLLVHPASSVGRVTRIGDAANSGNTYVDGLTQRHADLVTQGSSDVEQSCIQASTGDVSAMNGCAILYPEISRVAIDANEESASVNALRSTSPNPTAPSFAHTRRVDRHSTEQCCRPSAVHLRDAAARVIAKGRHIEHGALDARIEGVEAMHS